MTATSPPTWKSPRARIWNTAHPAQRAIEEPAAQHGDAQQRGPDRLAQKADVLARRHSHLAVECAFEERHLLERSSRLPRLDQPGNQDRPSDEAHHLEETGDHTEYDRQRDQRGAVFVQHLAQQHTQRNLGETGEGEQVVNGNDDPAILGKERRVPAEADMIALLCGMLFAAVLLLVPIVWLSGAYMPLHWPWRTAEWAVMGMALISNLSYAAYLYLIQVAGPVFASQTGYVVTLSGVFWGMLIFGERHSPWVWLAPPP